MYVRTVRFPHLRIVWPQSEAQQPQVRQRLTARWLRRDGKLTCM
ncbi:MAG: hypothetical protein AAGB13_05950 [Cyanobacteria bacterium P01_F01_bin.33]